MHEYLIYNSLIEIERQPESTHTCKLNSGQSN